MRRTVPQEVEGCHWINDTEWWDVDDGHVPENLRSSEATTTTTPSHLGTNITTAYPTRLVRYNEYHEDRVVAVVDDSLPIPLTMALYEKTARATAPWGCYVTVEEVQRYWQNKTTATTENNNNNNNLDNYITKKSPNGEDGGTNYSMIREDRNHQDEEEQALALQAVAGFLHHVLATSEHSSSTNEPGSRLLQHAHGVAVWALASDEGSQVPYHIDYAEQLRYEYNIIVPPLWGGTLHCTPIESVSTAAANNNYSTMRGGHYCVHTGGLTHYNRYGYKGLKQKKMAMNETDDEIDWKNVMATEGTVLIETIPNKIVRNPHKDHWIDVPFLFNRMILASGHLPHLSTPIESLPQFPPNHQSQRRLRRVIVGFNVFRHDIGPFVQLAPEHSPAFRRRILMHRMLRRQPAVSPKPTGTAFSTPSSSRSTVLSLEDIKSKPWLSKCLIRAKRLKMREEFLRLRNEMDEQIDRLLQETGIQPIQHLMDRWANSGIHGSWPNAIDLYAHIQLRCREGRWKLITIVADHNHFESNGTTVSPADRNSEWTDQAVAWVTA